MIRFFFLMIIIMEVGVTGWSVAHKKIFTDFEHARLNGLYTITTEKLSVMPFSQLIFSWDSMPLRTGFYTFWAQVRNYKTKKWGVWHKMMDWGATHQRSYAHLGTTCFSTYHHVRLEVDPAVLADGYRIKIVAHGGADLSSLWAYGVNIANFLLFEPEDVSSLVFDAGSVYVKGVDRHAQLAVAHKDNKRICSPTCCSLLTSYLSGLSIDPAVMADMVYDPGLDAYGSWQFNTASLFHHNHHRQVYFFVVRLNSFLSVYEQLVRGIPVVLSVKGAIEGAPKEYPHGHLLTVVGYDAKKKMVICHDSATDMVDEVCRYYPLESFVRAWERSRRLVYWVDVSKKGGV